MILFMTLISFSAAAQVNKSIGKFSITLSGNDTMHIIKTFVTNAENEEPIKDVEFTLSMERTFGQIEVGKGKTDSLGVAIIAIRKNVRGNSAGKVIFILKEEDNAQISDTIIKMEMAPDLPNFLNHHQSRALISHQAPWWLIITFWTLLLTVVFVFAYIMYLIFLIKISHSNANNLNFKNLSYD